MHKIREYPATWLVAHRGDQGEHVENTLAAFKAAARCGARFAECDIQFTRDLVPVVIHDDCLKRLCDLALHVSQLDLIDLKELCYPYFKLLTLRKLMAWLEGQPQLTLFLEVKPDIRTRLSDNKIAALLATYLPEPLLGQMVLISESGCILDACRAALECRIGWVHEGEAEEDDKSCDDSHRRPATRLDYIFMPYSKAASLNDWQSQGVKVGLYTINDTELAESMCKLGADLIETNHFVRLFSELERSRDGN